MSDSLRNLANRYTLNNYPYMDNPHTQARWDQLGADMPGPEPEPIAPAEMLPVTTDVSAESAVMPQATSEVSWFEKNRPLLIGIAAGLGLLAFLKSRE